MLAIQRAACVKAFAHIYPPELYPYPDDAVRAIWRRLPAHALRPARALERRRRHRAPRPRARASARAGQRHREALDARGELEGPALLREARLDAHARDTCRSLSAEPDRRAVRKVPL